jgi:hypothetical protein
MENKPIAAVLFLVIAAAGCTKSDQQTSGNIGFSEAYAASPAVALYPPLDRDAKDGHVHEYY